MTVEHVTVNAGGQAIAGAVARGRGAAAVGPGLDPPLHILTPGNQRAAKDLRMAAPLGL